MDVEDADGSELCSYHLHMVQKDDGFFAPRHSNTAQDSSRDADFERTRCANQLELA